MDIRVAVGAFRMSPRGSPSRAPRHTQSVPLEIASLIGKPVGQVYLEDVRDLARRYDLVVWHKTKRELCHDIMRAVQARRALDPAFRPAPEPVALANDGRWMRVCGDLRMRPEYFRRKYRPSMGRGRSPLPSVSASSSGSTRRSPRRTRSRSAPRRSERTVGSQSTTQLPSTRNRGKRALSLNSF